MKLELDNNEVSRILTSYSSNTLHIPANRMELTTDGVTLWWEEPPPVPQRRREGLAVVWGALADVLLFPVRLIFGSRT